MSKNTDFEFIQLRDAVNESNNILEKISTIKDKISNDITLLEEYLQKINPPDDFSYDLPMRTVVDRAGYDITIMVEAHITLEDATDSELDDIIELHASSPGRDFENSIGIGVSIYQDVISWDATEKRLIHVTECARGIFALNEKSGQHERLIVECFGSVDKSPLIESKYKTKEKIVPYLPEFVQYLAAQYKSIAKYHGANQLIEVD